MREYLDRSIDAYWDEQGEDKGLKLVSTDDEEMKQHIGDKYIELRGMCKANGLWFEEAVGYAYSKLKEENE